MENYLKGKQKLEAASKQLDSVKSFSNIKRGLPVQDISKVEINSGEGQPVVECVTQDGRITRIIITCKCGEQIELNCKYGP
jgi:hypothetical protein